MSVTKRGDKWVTRWNENGRQRAQTFNTRKEAHEHDVIVRGNGPGRPEIGRPIQIRLDADLITWADEKARELGQPRAAFIRDALDYARALEYPGALEEETS